MRTVTKLFFDYFGVKYFAFIPLFMIAVFQVFNWGGFTISELILPLNIGVFVALVFLGFGTYNNLILLGRSLPVDTRRLALALQLSYYVMLAATFLPVFILAAIRDLSSQGGTGMFPETMQVFLNIAAMWILISCILPFLLSGKSRKPKIIAACLSLPLPAIFGGVLQYYAEKQAVSDPGMLYVLAMLLILGMVAAKVCNLVSGRKLERFEV